MRTSCSRSCRPWQRRRANQGGAGGQGLRQHRANCPDRSREKSVGALSAAEKSERFGRQSPSARPAQVEVAEASADGRAACFCRTAQTLLPPATLCRRSFCPGLNIIWASSVLRCGEKGQGFPEWVLVCLAHNCRLLAATKLKPSRRSKLFPKTARPHREIFLPAPARRPLDFLFSCAVGSVDLSLPKPIP